MATLTTFEKLASLNSRDLQREATKIGVKNSRDYKKEDLLEQCKIALAAKESAANAKADMEETIEAKKPMVKVASVSTPLPIQKAKTEKVKKVEAAVKVKKAKKEKVEKPIVQYHEMERGEFMQHYPAKKPFPLATPLLSVFAKKDKETGKLHTWLENSKGEMIGEVEHSYMKTYRRAIELRKSEASLSNHKVVVYFEHNLDITE